MADEKKPHSYGEPVDTPSIGVVDTCSRCGQTRVRSPEPLSPSGIRTLYRLQADQRAFATELPCLSVDSLLRLARSASTNEARSAASKAISLINEHKLVFYPCPPILGSALAQLAAAKTEDEKREAALAVVRASNGATLAGGMIMTPVERDALHKLEGARRAQQVETRVTNVAQELGRFGRSVLSALAGSVEVAEGVTMRDAGKVVFKNYRDAEQELADFRREFADLFGGAEPRRTNPSPTRSKPPKPPKKAAPRNTKPATKKPPKKGSRKR